MIRKILKTSCLALLLILLLTLSAAWLRSYWVPDEIVHLYSDDYAYAGGGTIYYTTIGSARGAIYHVHEEKLIPSRQSTDTPEAPFSFRGYQRQGVYYFCAWTATGKVPWLAAANWRKAGFDYVQGYDSEFEYELRWRRIVIPYWAPILLFSLPLWFFAASWRKAREQHRRRKNNLCLHCAYDLRAHHPGDKCPECGTLIPRSDIPNR